MSNLATQIETIATALVNEMIEADKASKAASARLDMVKAKIKAFAASTSISTLDTPLAKLTVYSVAGGKYLDPQKVKGIISEEQYESCLSPKADSINLRLTMKNA